MTRRFPAPWSVERIEGGFKVLDDTGQALAYVYFRTSAENADAAKALTPEIRRGASLRTSRSCLSCLVSRPGGRFLIPNASFDNDGHPRVVLKFAQINPEN